MAYEFKKVNGRLVAKGNYPWRKLGAFASDVEAEIAARYIERKTKHACKGEMKAVWIQGDLTPFVMQALEEARNMLAVR